MRIALEFLGGCSRKNWGEVSRKESFAEDGPDEC